MLINQYRCPNISEIPSILLKIKGLFFISNNGHVPPEKYEEVSSFLVHDGGKGITIIDIIFLNVFNEFIRGDVKCPKKSFLS
jgi:hypothetical protein